MRNLFRLIGYIRFHRGQLALAVVAVGGTLFFTLMTPWMLARAIDIGIAQKNYRALALTAGIIVLLNLGRGLFAYMQSYLGESISQHIAFDLRHDYYERLQALSFTFHDRMETGQLMSRATVDVESARQFIGQSLLRLVFAVGLLFGVAGIMLALDWRLGVLTLATVPAVMFVSYHVSKRTRPLWLQVQQQISAETSVLQESIAGIRVVKAYVQEARQFERFRAAN